MNAIINAGTLALTAWSVADTLGGKQPDPDKEISVSMLTGIAPNSGGSVPHVAVWDADGNRVGQYKGDANGHIDGNDQKTVVISPDQNGGKTSAPEYVLIVMQESDAICLSGIIASGDGEQWIWTGDMAYTCGAQWYPSKRTIGASNSPIKCAWLDSDHSNGIIAKGLSLHMRDFSGDQGLVDQYRKDQRRLCQNSARMTFQPEPVVPDSIPPFFHPALEYTSEKGGSLKKPNQGIDRKQRAYPDHTNMNIHDTKKRRHARDMPKSKIAGIKNNMPGHLVVSDVEGHSAKELCEHPASLGPDFVSKREGLFCDMETGKTWPLCDQSTHTENCFDLESQTMRQPQSGPHAARSEETHHILPRKEYKGSEQW